MPTSSTGLVKATCKLCHKEYEVGRKAHVCAEAPCPKCGHMIKKSNLPRHVESCGKANKCKKCGELFQSQGLMKAHSKSCTGAPAAPATPPALTPAAAAPATPVTPATPATSARSAASSPGTPQVPCPTCGLLFHKPRLASHRSACGKWTCAKCGMAFPTRDHMRQHAQRPALQSLQALHHHHHLLLPAADGVAPCRVEPTMRSPASCILSQMGK